jgi:hypothetical protein
MLQGRWVFDGIDADVARRPPPGARWNAASYYRLCFEDHILKKCGGTAASQRKAGAAQHALSKGVGLGVFMRTQPTLIA